MAVAAAPASSRTAAGVGGVAALVAASKSASVSAADIDTSVGLTTALFGVFIVFLSALIGVLAPLLMTSSYALDDGTPDRESHNLRARRLFCLGNSFAAGFLTAAALVHLLPDADRELRALCPHVKFPVASALAVAGACAVLCLDVILRHRAVAQTSDHRGSLANSCDHELMHNHEDLSSPTASTPLLHRHLHSDPCVLTSPRIDRSVHATRVAGTEVMDSVPFCLPHVANHQHMTNHNFASSAHIHTVTPPSSSNGAVLAPNAKSSTTARAPSSSAIMAYVLFAALSFHSLVEGLSLGMSKPSRDQFVALLLAILAHKIFAAFTLGISLVSSSHSMPATQAQRKDILYAAIGFAATTPCGAAVGLTVSSFLLPHAARIAAAVMSSFSAGIFLFVAFVQLVAEEFRCVCDERCNSSGSTGTQSTCCVGDSSHARSFTDDSLFRAGFFVLSAAAMSALAIWV